MEEEEVKEAVEEAEEEAAVEQEEVEEEEERGGRGGEGGRGGVVEFITQSAAGNSDSVGNDDDGDDTGGVDCHNTYACRRARRRPGHGESWGRPRSHRPVGERRDHRSGDKRASTG
jgi:hypothetical protein